MSRSPWVITLCMGSAALLAGCPKETSPTPAGGGAGAPVASADAAGARSAMAAAPGSATAAAPGSATAAAADSEVASTLDTAAVLCVARALHQGGLDVAGVAEPRLRESEVRELAATMKKDHGHGLEKVTALAIQLGGVAPKESDLSQALTREAAETVTRLKGVDDASIDREYLASQVAMHRRALQVLDESLIPAAGDMRIRDALTRMRSQVTHHLRSVEEVGN